MATSLRRVFIPYNIRTIKDEGKFFPSSFPKEDL